MASSLEASRSLWASLAPSREAEVRATYDPAEVVPEEEEDVLVPFSCPSRATAGMGTIRVAPGEGGRGDADTAEPEGEGDRGGDAAAAGAQW